MRSLAAALCVCATLWSLPALAEQQDQKPGEQPAEAGSAALRAAPLAGHPLHADLDALYQLQDATARGRQDAAALQKPLLLAIAAKLAEGGAEDGVNERAPMVAGYVLSGGNPAAAEELSKAEGLRPANRNLLKGVSLFMQGDRKEAAAFLKPVDTARLPARIAGRVALAQALLEKQPADRQQALSRAIALMPGTLVEESALRRSALGFAETREEKWFWRRLERYQRRFPDSLYARAFWEEAMQHIQAWNAKGHGPDLARLDSVLQEMPAPRRRSLYLHLAQRSATVNNAALAVHAARRVARLAVPGSQEDQVAKLYLALYAVASENGDQASAVLQSLERGLLNTQEQAMLDAGLSVSRQISSPLDETGNTAQGGEAEKGPLLVRGEGLLADVGKLLSEQGS